MVKRCKTAAEKRHHAAVGEMPCVGCGAHGVQVHHVTSDGFKRIGRDHMRVVPLCSVCHTDGFYAVHRIGHAAFNRRHKVDLLNEAERLANG